MKPYSDFAPRRTRQVLADVIALVLIACWIWLGVAVHALISDLAAYGEQIEDAGADFRQSMTEVGETLGGVPLIGQGIRAPFTGASDAGGVLEAAGRSQQELVDQLAVTLGVGIATLPVIMILVVWLVPRLRFAVRAGRARSMVRAGVGIDLLALRALTNLKISTIARVDRDAMGAWRRGDEVVMRALAAQELERSGIRLSR
ncbi:hypothetical protein [Microbacterium sp. P03]|uniref:hypothetical protein n=1 Tax=Microbacterium sp. P03 TaxID=3366946 RepID=UPI003745D231